MVGTGGTSHRSPRHLGPPLEFSVCCEQCAVSFSVDMGAGASTVDDLKTQLSAVKDEDLKSYVSMLTPEARTKLLGALQAALEASEAKLKEAEAKLKEAAGFKAAAEKAAPSTALAVHKVASDGTQTPQVVETLRALGKSFGEAPGIKLAALPTRLRRHKLAHCLASLVH